MGSRTEYFADKRIIVNHFSGDLTYEDVRSFDTETVQWMRKGAAPVHIVFDTTELKQVKVGLAQMMTSAHFPHEPNLGWVIIVGTNPLSGFFGSMVLQMRRLNYRFFDNIDDAFQLLDRLEATR